MLEVMNTNYLKNICKHLGENNKPTYVVMAIAAVKGICRPAFTMMDKTEEPKTKKYTAIREGLTEVIAIPVYFACGELSARLSKFLPKDLQKSGGKNFMFAGVCAAALFVIPALCSAAIKPIMDSFYHNGKGLQSQQASKIEPKQIYTPPVAKINRPNINSFGNRPNIGIKVGGL